MCACVSENDNTSGREEVKEMWNGVEEERAS